MKLKNKIISAILVLIVAGLGIVATYVPVHDVDVQQNRHESYVGDIAKDVLVGQTFVAEHDNLAAVSVYVSPFSVSEEERPIFLHVRSSIHSEDDLRVGEISSEDIQEEGFYRVEFEPITESKGQEYFFYIVSPGSTSGNAVTVGANADDAYSQGAAYIVRDKGKAITNPEVLRVSLEQSIDLAFKTYYFAPLRDVITNNVMNVFHFLVSTWQDNFGLYVTWSKIVVPTLLIIWLLVLLRQGRYEQLVEKYGEKAVSVMCLVFLILAGAGLRFMYAVELPVTADEGRYLYDAKLISQSELAGGDGYVKAPLLVGWLALWYYVFSEESVLLGRMSSIVVSALSVFPMYVMVKHLWDRRVALAAATLWSLTGISVLYGIYIHTQPLAIFFVLCSMAALVTALRRNPEKKQFHLIVIAGIFLALAMLSRKSVLVLSLLPLVLIIIEAKAWRRLSYLVAYAIGVLLIVVPAVGLADTMYGDQGAWEVLGINSMENGLSRLESAGSSRWYEDSIQNILPLLKHGLPILVLFLIGLGITGEKFLRAGIKSMLDVFSWEPNAFVDHVLPKVMWVFPAFIYVLGWSVWDAYGDSTFMLLNATTIWIVWGVVMLIFVIWPRSTDEKIVKAKSKTIVPYSTQPNVATPYPDKKQSTQTMAIYPLITPTIIGPLWLIALAVFYASWIKFNTDYIAEFVPVLVLMASFGGAYFIDRLRKSSWLSKKIPGMKVLRFLVIFPVILLLTWSFVISNYATYSGDYIGTYEQGVLRDAATWARVNIPSDETVFTGLPVVPYLSGHRTVLDIAHSGWYAYEFTQSDTERLNAFLPSISEVMESFQNSRWVLVEEKTKLHFINPYAAIRNGLRDDFEVVKTINNGDNDLIFYERR